MAGPGKPARRRRAEPVPDVPLGSLSQPRTAVSGPATCPGCASPSLTRLSLPNAAGTAAVFVSCHDCERSGWYATQDGRELSRGEVLGQDDPEDQ